MGAARALHNMLFGSLKAPAPKPLPILTIELAGEAVTVTMKRHAAARRMVLRQTRDGSGFTLTVPKRHSIASAKAFLDTSKDWMLASRARRETPVPLVSGARLPLRGNPLTLASTGRMRGTLNHDVEQATLHVPGQPAHMKRRVTDWLKQQALADLTLASRHYADAMGCHFSRIVVRDQKSRWGSCSSDGVLSYSWRLVLAPDYVLDYVAAHEVAHLREMNHGPRFWRLVLTHCPTARAAKLWLKKNGRDLHRYG